MKKYLDGVPTQFRIMLKKANEFRRYFGITNTSLSMYLKVHRNGEFVQIVDVSSVEELEMALVDAKNSIESHKKGGSIALTTSENGLENYPLAIVNVF